MDLKETAREQALLPGDVVVVRRKGFNLFDHYFVYLGQDQRGEPIYAANLSDAGQWPRRFSPADLARQERLNRLSRVRRLVGGPEARKAAAARAVGAMARPRNYRLLRNNCEHYANFVQYGEPFSRQSQNFYASLAASGALALGALAVRNAAMSSTLRKGKGGEQLIF